MAESTASTAGKPCHVCGIDCTGRPRTRDKAGRYYCDPCRARIREARAALDSSASSSGSLADLTAEASVADEIIAALGGIEKTAPAEAAPQHCDHCALLLPEGAVICLACGYDNAAGRFVKVNKRLPHAPRFPIWHYFIGGVSAMLGLVGVIFYAWMLLISEVEFRWDQQPWLNAAALCMRALPLLMAGWLAFGGAGVTLQRRDSYALLQRWAIASLAVGGVVALTAGVGTFALLNSDDAREALGSHAEAVLTELGIAAGVLIFWPLVILISAVLPQVKGDVERWI